MTTTAQKQAAAKPAAKKTAAKAPAKTAESKPAAKKAAAPKEPNVPSYREAADFGDAMKAARSSAKDNGDLKSALQLITHLTWKTPGGKVGWVDGTTPAVVEYAADLAIAEGTPIPEALEAALAVAEKAAAADKPQKDAVAVLAKIVRGHTA
jgi:hypothetical protein